MFGRRLVRSVTVWVLCWMLAGQASAGRFDTDRPGATDHPLVSRYAGSVLYFHGGENYGTAPMLARGRNGVDAANVEGKISNRLYWAPAGRTALEVFRNYQGALKDAGFDIVYECDTAQCDRDQAQLKMIFWVQRANWINRKDDDYYLIRAFQGKPNFHYVHARKRGAQGNVDVQVAVRTSDHNEPMHGRVLQFVQVVEAASMDQGKVTVDAAAIGSALQREGKIALYGIYFDTNRAEIKPDSNAALAEMAKALKNNPSMNVFIVGHTDNVGNVETNLSLSRRRAQAVAEALARQHGIAAARVQAQGVANFAPLASNASEEGRAKNRRVEMVVR